MLKTAVEDHILNIKLFLKYLAEIELVDIQHVRVERPRQVWLAGKRKERFKMAGMIET